MRQCYDLEDVSAVRRYAESVLSNPRSVARYIERARTEILQQNRLYHITTSQDRKTVSATCEGSHPDDRYKLQITLEGAEPAIECSCPAKEKEALCKHSLGLLLWRAGNLTEERLKRQTEAVGQPQQHLSDVDTASPAPGQHGAGQAEASEQATVAYQAAETPTPPPVARTVAPTGKRRLPASFAQRRNEPAAKKGSAAGKKGTPVKPVTTVAAGPAQSRGKGQVQSKLSFQTTSKKEKPAEQQPLHDNAKADRHVPRAPLIRRQRPPASQPQRCSAQAMLDISDDELLRLCRSTLEAATAESTKHEASKRTLSSAAADPVPQPVPASERTLQHQAADQLKPVHLQHPAKPPSRKLGLAEEDTEQIQGPLSKVTMQSVNLTGADASAISIRSADGAEGSVGAGVGDAAASCASADLLTFEAGPSSGPRSVPPSSAGVAAARSMLEELLGDTFHLLADPAPTAEEQRPPAKEASQALRVAAPQVAGHLCDSEPAAAPASCLALAAAETQPGGAAVSAGCTRTAEAQAVIASDTSRQSDSEVSLHPVQQTPVAPSLQPVLGCPTSMQPPGHHPAKKLTLREKLRILKESG